ncbi:MAG: S-layer homology domain-containing protein [Bacillota bacterium]|nr:S-layer homology domain-containing protein [Bacillota bacterium]
MRRLFAISLALIMCLTLLPMAAFAALPASVEAPQAPKAALDDDIPDYAVEHTDQIYVTYTIPASLRSFLLGTAEAEYQTRVVVQMDWSIDSESDWKCSGTDTWSSVDEHGRWMTTMTYDAMVDEILAFDGYRIFAEAIFPEICVPTGDEAYCTFDLTNHKVYMKLRFMLEQDSDGEEPERVYSGWTEVFTVGEELDEEEWTASSWAKAELAEADALRLIPERLQNADLTQDITRAEFAAVAVKAYEALSGTAAIPAVNDPFTDCKDAEVLKAYNIGAVNGTSATTFTPDALLNREQAATMLTRVFKKVSMPGWSLATDADFTLNYTKGAAFADDAEISDYARDSVYFMAANGIISGMGNNLFAPKNITSAQEANGYANATREQALIIAVRMVQNLGD